MPEGHECTEKSLEYFKMYEHMTHAKALYQKKRDLNFQRVGEKWVLCKESGSRMTLKFSTAT